MPTTSRSTLYRLLYSALIEIRAAGRSGAIDQVILLADLFHNVPLQLERVDQGEASDEDVMRWLRERAQRNGIVGWLYLRIDEAIRYERDMSSQEDTAP